MRYTPLKTSTIDRVITPLKDISGAQTGFCITIWAIDQSSEWHQSVLIKKKPYWISRGDFNWKVSDPSLFMSLLGGGCGSWLVMNSWLWGRALGHWQHRLFDYLSDFAENRLEVVSMCQNDTYNIISSPGHKFHSYHQNSKMLHMSIIGWGTLGSV